MSAYIPVNQRDDEFYKDYKENGLFGDGSEPPKQEAINESAEAPMTSKQLPNNEDDGGMKVGSRETPKFLRKMSSARGRRVLEEYHKMVLPGYGTLIGMLTSATLVVFFLFVWIKAQQASSVDHWFVDWSENRYSSAKDVVRDIHHTAVVLVYSVISY